MMRSWSSSVRGSSADEGFHGASNGDGFVDFEFLGGLFLFFGFSVVGCLSSASIFFLSPFSFVMVKEERDGGLGI